MMNVTGCDLHMRSTSSSGWRWRYDHEQLRAVVRLWYSQSVPEDCEGAGHSRSGV